MAFFEQPGDAQYFIPVAATLLRTQLKAMRGDMSS